MPESAATQLSSLISSSHISSVKAFAWRDLDDAEAGGSEIHADEVLRRWAAAGLSVTLRTSAVAGRPKERERDGYRVVRRSGRYQVFPDAIIRGLRRDRRHYDAFVDIWNGVPFLTPLWARRRSVAWLHHVHADMWKMTLGPRLARVGWFLEHRIFPLAYRRTTVCTLSNSSAHEIDEKLHLKRVRVIPPGIADKFQTGGARSDTPLIVAVGRLAPVKRFDLLLQDFAEVHAEVPAARFVVVGEGFLRSDLEALAASLGISDALTFACHVSDEELVALYQSAWLVVSRSLREGWGMTLTEAGKCGTPSVATDIAGHRDAVRDGVSGILVDPDISLASTITRVIGDNELLDNLRRGAVSYASELTWDRTALELFEALASSVPARGQKAISPK